MTKLHTGFFKFQPKGLDSSISVMLLWKTRKLMDDSIL